LHKWETERRGRREEEKGGGERGEAGDALEREAGGVSGAIIWEVWVTGGERRREEGEKGRETGLGKGADGGNRGEGEEERKGEERRGRRKRTCWSDRRERGEWGWGPSAQEARKLRD